ncbi:MAG: Ppx/GppA family phosphatase [Deltaproteobacteria bacterium]|nr:Ppx/GppA family phosphatase [Deltaproteobacteria bacterium]
MDSWRLATIDVGTNTVLLLVVEVDERGHYKVLEDRAEITRLGEGLQQTGIIGPAGKQRTLQALRAYRERCDYWQVREIKIAGTSALREASNAIEFSEPLKQDLGLDLRVLSAREEAWYSYLSVQKGLKGLAPECLVVDIGGGSTEFIWGKNGGLHRWKSYPMGTVKLTERYLQSDPARDEECRLLVDAIDRDLSEQLADWGPETDFRVMVGIAGTFTTLSAVEKSLVPYRPEAVHGSDLERKEVKRQIDLYRSKTLIERKQIPGLEPKRADVILAGALLIDRIMEYFRLNLAIVSDQGIRYGLLFERLASSQS